MKMFYVWYARALVAIWLPRRIHALHISCHRFFAMLRSMSLSSLIVLNRGNWPVFFNPMRVSTCPCLGDLKVVPLSEFCFGLHGPKLSEVFFFCLWGSSWRTGVLTSLIKYHCIALNVNTLSRTCWALAMWMLMLILDFDEYPAWLLLGLGIALDVGVLWLLWMAAKHAGQGRWGNWSIKHLCCNFPLCPECFIAFFSFSLAGHVATPWERSAFPLAPWNMLSKNQLRICISTFAIFQHCEKPHGSGRLPTLPRCSSTRGSLSSAQLVHCSWLGNFEQ